MTKSSSRLLFLLTAIELAPWHLYRHCTTLLNAEERRNGCLVNSSRRACCSRVRYCCGGGRSSEVGWFRSRRLLASRRQPVSPGLANAPVTCFHVPRSGALVGSQGP
uniref:Putative secreted protein n=1 Tax=Ixodes ricinus TaxID=34613 RepID=A0A6B0UDY7_IXORI